MNDRSRIGSLIRLKREEKLWTQQHLADAARLSLRTVQRVERGEGSAKESLLSLMAALDIGPEEINDLADIEIRLNQWMQLIMNRMKSLIRYGGISYAIVLVLVLLLVVSRFNGLYAIERPDDMDAFQAVFGPYVKVLIISAICLGIWMAVWASGVGVVYGKIWKGLAALAIAGIVTLFGYSLLPWVMYPADQYSPAATFIFVSVVPIALCWALVTVVLRKLASS